MKKCVKNYYLMQKEFIFKGTGCQVIVNNYRSITQKFFPPNSHKINTLSVIQEIIQQYLKSSVVLQAEWLIIIHTT